MSEVNAKGQTLEQFLDEYDESLYRHPSNTVDMILMTVSNEKLKLLLVKRGNHPFINDWALPGGFVNFEEDLDDAVERQLAEETNIKTKTYFRQLYTMLWKDSWQKRPTSRPRPISDNYIHWATLTETPAPESFLLSICR